jgi:hypothetical protein
MTPPFRAPLPVDRTALEDYRDQLQRRGARPDPDIMAQMQAARERAEAMRAMTARDVTAGPSGRGPAAGGPSDLARMGKLAANFAPGIGDGMALLDARNDAAAGNWGAAALNVASTLPIAGVVGDAARAAKSAKRSANAWEIVPQEEIGKVFDRLDPDEYLYHATSAPNARKIVSEGLQPNKKRLIGSSAYDGHSKGSVFLSDAPDASFWHGRAEDHLFDQFDNPPDAVLLRIKRELVSGIEPDEVALREGRRHSFKARGAIGGQP